MTRSQITAQYEEHSAMPKIDFVNIAAVKHFDRTLSTVVSY